MPELEPIHADHVTPILYVRDFQEAVAYYTKKLQFELLWDWGDPPEFGCVRLGRAEVFLCEGGQGKPGTWMSIFMDDVDGYGERIREAGADIVDGPVDEPWGCREMRVRDPNEHVIRFTQGLPPREPKLEIDRAPLNTAIEERLLALINDLAAHKRMTLGEVLEETLLHSFEPTENESVASPHVRSTCSHRRDLKSKHGIDYDAHASYRFVERAGEAPRNRRRRTDGHG